MSNISARLSTASTLANAETSNPKQESPAKSNITACENGDIEALMTSNNDDLTTSDIDKMFSAAASHRQVKTIEHLSSRFRSHKLGYGPQAVGFGGKDPATLAALLAHDPSIANYEENYYTKLFEFSSGADPTLPLLLLEFGADPKNQPSWPCKPLDAAVQEQPMLLIKKLVACGADVSDRTLRLAELAERKEVVEYLKEVLQGPR